MKILAVPPVPFTTAERGLVARLRTPSAVQRYLNDLPYNTEPPPSRATLRSFRGVMTHHTAHCLEAAITAAVVLEQHGYPPLLLSLESADQLDHVIFIYQKAGLWGSVGRSRDPGLHGRRPVFRTLRAMALTYFDPYVDKTGYVTAYGAGDLRALGAYDWRLSTQNVWKVERLLFDVPHRPIRSTPARVQRLRARYLAYRAAHAGQKPLYYDRSTWSELPREYSVRLGKPD